MEVLVAEERVKVSAARRELVDGRGAVTRAAAFRRLADEHLDGSYRLARAIMGDPDEAQDAVHDAFVTAWRKWDSLRDVARFEQWFRRIVVNTCRDRLRHASRHAAGVLPAEPPIAAGDAIGVVDDHAVLDQAFAGLSADDKVVIILRFFLDLSIEDIAELVDVRPGTVGSRLNRARARLRAALTDSEHREVAG